nr:photosystem II protein J [Haramonas pauciplastida]YP_010444172.1 photosystem II protein J [Haramonas pauciplastida]UTE95040.1 photosystem II protein J [Haramonas pauciplastida]UTE95058.1 photosystem II protein J [Haramonas pauciplastida]
MAGTGRIPLWIVATIGGLGVLAVVGTFLYGAYSGLGSSL